MTMTQLKDEEAGSVLVQGLLDRDLEPMDKDTSKFLVTLILLSEDEGMPREMMNEIQLDPGYRIIKGRLEAEGGEATASALAFLSGLCDGIPGRMVMWAYTLYRIHRKTGETVSLKDVCDFFPEGFPTESEHQKAWDEQKGANRGLECGNILDTYPWESLTHGDKITYGKRRD